MSGDFLLEVGKLYRVKVRADISDEYIDYENNCMLFSLLSDPNIDVDVPFGSPLLFLGLLSELDELKKEHIIWREACGSVGEDLVFLYGTERIVFGNAQFDREPEIILDRA